jgi:hypothetical protein
LEETHHAILVVVFSIPIAINAGSILGCPLQTIQNRIEIVDAPAPNATTDLLKRSPEAGIIG